MRMGGNGQAQDIYHIGTLDVTLFCLWGSCLSLESLSEGKNLMPGL